MQTVTGRAFINRDETWVVGRESHITLPIRTLTATAAEATLPSIVIIEHLKTLHITIAPTALLVRLFNTQVHITWADGVDGVVFSTTILTMEILVNLLHIVGSTRHAVLIITIAQHHHINPVTRTVGTEDTAEAQHPHIRRQHAVPLDTVHHTCRHTAHRATVVQVLDFQHGRPLLEDLGIPMRAVAQIATGHLLWHLLPVLDIDHLPLLRPSQGPVIIRTLKHHHRMDMVGEVVEVVEVDEM